MEKMAYIGSTWVMTVMWPVMMQTILISNVQEKKWRRLAGLLGGWWQHQSRMEMWCHAYRLTTKVSSPQKVDLNLNQPLMTGAILFPSITICQLCLIMTLVVIEREGVLGACPFEVLHILSVSLSYWSIYCIDISVPLLLCPISFSGVVEQVELTWYTQYWAATRWYLQIMSCFQWIWQPWWWAY